MAVIDAGAASVEQSKPVQLEFYSGPGQVESKSAGDERFEIFRGWSGASKTIEIEVRQFRLQGKTALVTGGASGIGRATAELFAREGAKSSSLTSAKRDMKWPR